MGCLRFFRPRGDGGSGSAPPPLALSMLPASSNMASRSPVLSKRHFLFNSSASASANHNQTPPSHTTLPSSVATNSLTLCHKFLGSLDSLISRKRSVEIVASRSASIDDGTFTPTSKSGSLEVCKLEGLSGWQVDASNCVDAEVTYSLPLYVSTSRQLPTTSILTYYEVFLRSNCNGTISLRFIIPPLFGGRRRSVEIRIEKGRIGSLYVDQDAIHDIGTTINACPTIGFGVKYHYEAQPQSASPPAVVKVELVWTINKTLHTKDIGLGATSADHAVSGFNGDSDLYAAVGVVGEGFGI